MIDIKSVFSPSLSAEVFTDFAIQIFNYQYDNNKIYRNFSRLIHRTPQNVFTLEEIPFLPISFFKTHLIQAGVWQPEITFRSSGTTGMQSSCNPIKSVALYEKSFSEGFRYFYGDPQDYCFLALLPSYLERGHSSLVYMIRKLMEQSRHPENGFFLYNHHDLKKKLLQLEEKEQKTMLWGVAYALLDFSESHPMPLKHTIIMETGGMKGKRKELIKNELHKILKERFELKNIHSEYGMAELMSQAYSQGDGIFRTPPWMRMIIRDPNDPLTLLKPEKKGGINIIDLANIHTCSFIATQDLGCVFNDETFSLSGRFDASDMRGCNLLVD